MTTTPAGPRPSMRRDFLVANLDLEAATGVEGAAWEHFQIAHLDDEGMLRAENKSRQIAWSWTTAAEAAAETQADIWGDQPRDSIFVSIRQEEAAEKIRYAHRVYEELARKLGVGRGRLHRLVRESVLNLEFDNGTRLTSFPATPPRGRARANVYLDEFAHVQRDREIYTAAMPIISKGGRLRIGSSPFGAAGMFWEIWSQAMRAYPGFARKATPWWGTQAFCLDVLRARRLAPHMRTADRVEAFGNSRLLLIHGNMDEDDFRQEYECEIVDESRSFFTWDEIRAVERVDLRCEIVTCRGSDVQPALEAIRRLLRATEQGTAELALAAGYDVGRTRDASELFVVGLAPAGDYPLRLAITLEGAPFDEQMQVLAALLDDLPITLLWIDRTGLGSQLAETMERRYPGKAAGQTFTNQAKMLWATNAKMLVQQHKILLPVDRDVAYQIHSIKKVITAAKNVVFDTDANERHHADKFWALALALAAAHAGQAGAPLEALEALFEYVG